MALHQRAVLSASSGPQPGLPIYEMEKYSSATERYPNAGISQICVEVDLAVCVNVGGENGGIKRAVSSNYRVEA